MPAKVVLEKPALSQSVTDAGTCPTEVGQTWTHTIQPNLDLKEIIQAVVLSIVI